jgi:uncharacterized protein (TIGR02391 family)
MAKVLKARGEVKKAIAARIRAGKDLAAKAEIAESTGGYEDWLFIFAKWREETAAELTTLYEERDIGRTFTAVTYEGGDYAEAVETSFKLARDRLRALTGYETGSEAFGKGHLYVDGAAATPVDEDFENGVKFLTMAIDRFRNEKSHTADGNISDPIRAYEYLRLSSLAMHLLEGAQRRSS